MFAAGIVDLFVRMVTSLALVLAIVAAAYFVMRRRAGTARAASARSTGPARAARRPTNQPRGARHVGGRRGTPPAVEVLGRVGLTRSSSAVALKFGDRVILVGASEQSQPAVLAEVDAATWELYEGGSEFTVPADVERDDLAPARPGFLDALREATVRRG
jgi:flagellar biogenesis protein FliO